MVPPFTDDGMLPAGIHPATLDEVDSRFGRGSSLRRVQMESLRWLVDLARRAGIERLIINGSFVTEIEEPNDIDWALLIIPHEDYDATALDDIADGSPFLDIHIVEPDDFTFITERFFSTDRENKAKALVEIIL